MVQKIVPFFRQLRCRMFTNCVGFFFVTSRSFSIIHSTNEQISWQLIMITFLDTSDITSGIIVASQSVHRHCWWHQRKSFDKVSILPLYFLSSKLPTTVFAQGHQSVGCRAKAKAFKNTRSGF
jgi:hypothetical protein